MHDAQERDNLLWPLSYTGSMTPAQAPDRDVNSTTFRHGVS